MSVHRGDAAAGAEPSFSLSISDDARLVEMVRDLATLMAEQRRYPRGEAAAIGQGVALVAETMRRASGGGRAIEVRFFTAEAALRIDLAGHAAGVPAESLERRLEQVPDDGAALDRLRATFASVSFGAQAEAESCRLACRPADG
jgi:hypothetical protein